MVPRTDMVTVQSDFRVAERDGGRAAQRLQPDPRVRREHRRRRRHRLRQGPHAGRARRVRVGGGDELSRPPTSSRRPSGWRELLREMQSENVPHGDRDRRVRRHRRARHPRGPDRGARRRGHRRHEYDVEDPRVDRSPAGDILVDGRLSIDEANEVLSGHLPEGEWDTVGGLLFSTLGKVPAEGDEVEADGVPPAGRKGRGRRITRVRIGPTRSIRRLRESGGGRRVRHARRTAERREVDAAEPDPRHEGHDRLRQAADTRTRTMRGAPPVRTRRSSSSTRLASTGPAPCWASGSTTPPRRRSTMSTWPVSCSTPPSRRAGATVRRGGCRAIGGVRRRQGRPGVRAQVVAQLPRRVRSRPLRCSPQLGPHR